MAKKEEFSIATIESRDQIPALLERALAKKDELKKQYGQDIEDLSNDNLEGFGNISSIEEVTTLVKAISSVKGREAAYKVAMKDVKVPGVTLIEYPFKVNGTSAKRWIEVINKRIGQVTYKDQLSKLDELVSVCEKYVSDDQRFINDMKRVGDILS